MVTYVTTTRNQFETPSGKVGEPPDGPGNMQHLAQNIDDRLGVGGAEYAANLAALQAIPAARLFNGKLGYAADTRIIHRWNTALATPAWQAWQTPWTTLPLATGLASQYGFTPAYRISDGEARLSGSLKKSSAAAFADGDVLVSALPALITPQAGSYVPAHVTGSSPAAIALVVSTTNLSVYSMKGSTTSAWIGLDNVGFRLYTTT